MIAPRVDIIVPTYGQAALTAACLRSIAATTTPAEVRLIWVDNGSAPEAREEIDAAARVLLHPVLRLWLPENLGYVKATNAGIAVSTAPHVLLLNNDTELPAGWYRALLEVMEEEPRVGIVGPRSSSPHQWQGRAPAGPAWQILGDRAMLAFFCALIRRDVIVACGYLSEEYRAGLGDDDDYCERVKRAGWRLALRQDVTVHHHHRTTFRDIYGDGGWLDYQTENLAHFKRKWGLA